VKVTSTALPEVVLIEPRVFQDARGFFLESFNMRAYADAGLPDVFVQDNHSRSQRGTLRGLHAQARQPQGKLVRVVAGEVFDVAVDVRRSSPRFSQWVGVMLSAENFRQLYVPPGFAHGFCVVSDFAEFEYKCTDYYDPESEVAIAWNDPAVGIEWPVVEAPLLSARDTAALSLAQGAAQLSAGDSCYA
jgi:dTDP-4-dehydrorhamnose 3,5-epimerase